MSSGIRRIFAILRTRLKTYVFLLNDTGRAVKSDNLKAHETRSGETGHTKVTEKF